MLPRTAELRVRAGVVSSDDVFVNAHTAIRLSVVPQKSRADNMYSVPPSADAYIAFGLVAGCSEYA